MTTESQTLKTKEGNESGEKMIDNYMEKAGEKRVSEIILE